MAEDQKHPGGRPPMYSSPEDMQAKIDDYFQNCPDYRVAYDKMGNAFKIPTITITGLALHLGFCNRQSMYDYENKPEFSDTIKRARSFVEKEYEMALSQGNCTGAIFALKNFGWKDKTEVDNNVVFNKLPSVKFADGRKMEFIVGDPDPGESPNE